MLIIGLCERQMRRWKECYEEFGYDGLFDHRLGKPSPKRVPLATVEEILRLYQEHYGDFNVRHFHEKADSYLCTFASASQLSLLTFDRALHRKYRPSVLLPT